MPTFVDTKTTLGEDGALDALVAHTLTEFADSDIKSIGQKAFQYQTGLETIYLPKVSSIAANAFLNCSNMKNFYIGTDNNTVATLSNSNAFSGTGRSIIRVKDNLVTNYRSASNWSALAGHIYGETDNTAPTWNETEIADDMETFKSHVIAGTAASRYGLGNYKTIDLGTEGSVKAQIMAKNVRELANSTDTAQLEFVLMTALNATRRMNPHYAAGTSGTGTLGGYDASEMKTYIEETIWPLFPQDWKDIIKECKIISCGYNTAGTKVANMESTAKISLLSHREVFGGTNYENTGLVYDFGFFDAGTRIRKINSSSATWWLRSASDKSNWMFVDTNGNGSSRTSISSSCLVLRFSV